MIFFTPNMNIHPVQMITCSFLFGFFTPLAIKALQGQCARLYQQWDLFAHSRMHHALAGEM